MNWRAILRWTGLLLVILGIVAGLIYVILVFGYSAAWTGFGASVGVDGRVISPKTLWDWMQLLLVPLGLAATSIGFGLIQERNRRHSERIAHDLESERARENALQALLDDIGQLIRDDNLGEEAVEGEEPVAASRRERIQELATAKTSTLLDVLKDDQSRRLHAIHFLARAGLITKHGVNLSKADLSQVNLQGIRQLEIPPGRMSTLTAGRVQTSGSMLIADSANLQGALLAGASLNEVKLGYADLQGAMLISANLQRATLDGANLKGAWLGAADLQGAILIQANLQAAVLVGANLRGVDLTTANLQGAKLDSANLRGAVGLDNATFDQTTTLPDGTHWAADADLARFTNPKHPNFWQLPKQPRMRTESVSPHNEDSV